MKLIVMSGLPCSGKSTIATEINKNLGYEILSYDDTRESYCKDVGISYEESFEDGGVSRYLTKLFHNRREELIFHGFDIILDSTNLISEGRINLKNLFPGYDMSCIFVNTPFEECIRRNSERNEKYIPQEVFDDFKKKLTIPSNEEGFKEVHII